MTKLHMAVAPVVLLWRAGGYRTPSHSCLLIDPSALVAVTLQKQNRRMAIHR